MPFAVGKRKAVITVLVRVVGPLFLQRVTHRRWGSRVGLHRQKGSEVVAVALPPSPHRGGLSALLWKEEGVRAPGWVCSYDSLPTDVAPGRAQAAGPPQRHRWGG